MSNIQTSISTPPGTTLSTPSPTEIRDQDLMPKQLKQIYLVVATTPVSSSSGARHGIGIKGKLPWPTIRADMNYFKLVTRDGSSTGTLHGLDAANVDQVSNVVIMGRKTWSSIPASFRPLSHRVNVVVTRSSAFDVAQDIARDLQTQKDKLDSMESEKKKDIDRKAQQDPTGIAAQRLQLAEAKAFQTIGKRSDGSVLVRSDPPGKVPGIVVDSNIEDAVEHFSQPGQPGDVFCIGGAEIYGALLKIEKLRPRLRIIQTEIIKTNETEFECDTYWPEKLEGSDSQWQEAETREVESWIGIKTPQGTLMDSVEDTDVGVRLRVRGWVFRGS